MQTTQSVKQAAIYEQYKTFHCDSLLPNDACLIQQNIIMVKGELVCHVSTTTDYILIANLMH